MIPALITFVMFACADTPAPASCNQAYTACIKQARQIQTPSGPTEQAHIPTAAEVFVRCDRELRPIQMAKPAQNSRVSE